MKRRLGDQLFQFGSLSLLTVLTLLMVLPFYIVVILSVSTPAAVAAEKAYLFPSVVDFSAYAMVLEGTYVGNAFLVSFALLLVGTALNLALTLSAGYVLARKSLPGVKTITLILLFTMLFNGGLIPFYLTVKSLGLINSFWVMVFPSAVDTFLLVIAINYFRTIPPSLEESARMDGASDLTTLVQVVLPVAKPVIATLLLFYAVQRWNEWWLPLMFINDVTLQPLQYVIRQALIQISSVVNTSAGAALADTLRNQSGEAMKMATVILSILPLLALYPFLTKYFNQGVLLGSIKE